MDVVEQHPLILKPVILVAGAAALAAMFFAVAVIVAGAVVAYGVDRITGRRLLRSP